MSVATDRAPPAPPPPGPAAAPRLGEVVALALWLGLLAGLGEAGVLLVRRHVIGDLFEVNPAVIWASPAADAVVFALAGLVVAGTARLLPARHRRRFAWFALVFLALASVAARLPFARWATVLLAAGVAARVSAWAAARPASAAGAIRATLLRAPGGLRAPPSPWRLPSPVRVGFTGAVVVGALAAWHELGRFTGELAAMEGLPEPPPSAPNVLVVVMDTVRAESLGLHGYVRDTSPELEKLAARGATFDRAYSAAPWTLPAHAALFTGRWHHEIDADWRSPLGDRHATLAEVLAARGYATGGFVANTIYCTRAFGLGRGFARYEDYPSSPGQLALASAAVSAVVSWDALRRVLGEHEVANRKSAGEVNSAFLEWLDATDRPFFAFLNYFDAHEPYLPPPPFDTRYGPPRSAARFTHSAYDAARTRKFAMTEEERLAETAAYDGAIAYLDHELGRLLDELERRGRLGNTLIVVTADHGEQLGERGLYDHTNSLYAQVLHVPLVVVLPGRVPAGGRIAEPVTTRDVGATVLDLLGAPASLPGGSLAGLAGAAASDAARPPADALYSEIHAAGNERSFYPLARGPMRSVVSGGVHFIRHGDGSELAYDVIADPREERDVLPLLPPEVVERLRTLVTSPPR